MLKKIKNTSLLKFLDKNILFILSIILLAFIPLYPKLPLFDLIEGYIVRVRLEDFLIAFTLIVYFIQLLRKKISLDTPITKIIFAYIIIGFLSTISGIYITQTIPTTQVHLLKSFLHFFRYIEYFSIFFIISASIKTKKEFQIALTTVVLTLLIVGVYGVGQKYLYWPVYSTMNREFSKGITLYLTPHARVQSTFAGHYDMAAYLVLLLPIILTLSFYIKNKMFKIILWSSYALGLFLMILSASRTSLAGLVVALFTSIFLASLLEKTFTKKISFFIKKSLITGIIFLAIFIPFGENMAERLLQSLENTPIIHQTIIRIEDQSQNLISQINLDQYINIYIKKPENGLSTEQAAVLVSSDTRPSTIKPSDVYVDVPNQVRISTVSATGEKITTIIEVPRTYSDNAIKHGLSLAIRLDTLWPQAIAGFYKNPVLGTGYATLTKSEVNQFTEADSTDNNFLRTLGENGLLGFVTFYGSIVISLIAAQRIIKKSSSTQQYKKYFAIGFIGSTIGLLVNAAFIDVFAASKVAYTYWAFTGILIASENILAPKIINKKTKSKKRIFKKKDKFNNT